MLTQEHELIDVVEYVAFVCYSTRDVAKVTVDTMLSRMPILKCSVPMLMVGTWMRVNVLCQPDQPVIVQINVRCFENIGGLSPSRIKVKGQGKVPFSEPLRTKHPNTGLGAREGTVFVKVEC